ncbi:MAG TPA: thioredoxin domain-containing protein [Muribaculum sp.]|uniref:thioredoxin family protein n=1 Tax=Heminiphilus faecis TaxID=2601703 RepID=UPI0019674AC2|nr:thioredoxin domain-containing protein [Heminiphilus faecis]HRF68510.1 thioredoxin domain-containing protein [Muribaculum sp.]
MIKRFFTALSLTCILAMSAEAQEPVKAIGQEEFMKEIFNYRSDTVQPVRPTLVDFWAPWCAPCLRLSPIIDSLAVKYKGQVDFRKLNIDENKDLARDLGINSIPLVVLFPNDGRPMRGMMGVQPAEFIDQSIKEYLLPKSTSE